MAGIPKRRSGERDTSYRLRCWDAELTRRDEKLIKRLETQLDGMRELHEKQEKVVYAELCRAWRAKPGTKYDITARKKK
jgi:hypothetical protein